MNIYVGNLPYSTTREDLEALFGEFGAVQAARVVMDRESGRSKGFGFVEMDDEAGKAAIEKLNGSEIGSVLAVQILLNLGMCLGLLPVIGITLPFLSCGGSSMLAVFMMMGLLHNVYSHSHAVRVAHKGDTFDIDSSLL